MFLSPLVLADTHEGLGLVPVFLSPLVLADTHEGLGLVPVFLSPLVLADTHEGLGLVPVFLSPLVLADFSCRYQPTEEDKELYKNYKGDRSLLQQADMFLLKVGV